MKRDLFEEIKEGFDHLAKHPLPNREKSEKPSHEYQEAGQKQSK